jgi:hypothetical protein
MPRCRQGEIVFIERHGGLAERTLRHRQRGGRPLRPSRINNSEGLPRRELLRRLICNPLRAAFGIEKNLPQRFNDVVLLGVECRR